MVEIVDLALEPPEKYVLKGHNLSEEEIVKSINEHEHADDEIKKKTRR